MVGEDGGERNIGAGREGADGEREDEGEREQKLEEVSNRYLRDIVATYPTSKEAEEAKKLLPKEDRLAAEAEAAKIKDAAVIPEATAKPDAPKADNANNNDANK